MIPKSRGLAIVVAAFAAGAAGLALPAVALAEGTDVQQLGQQGKLVDGGNVSGWTVGALKPSSDVIPFTPRGTLWEATATEEAIAGGAQPFIPDFSARAANGETYHVLFQVPSAQGVNPSGLGQGQSVTGKLYFDVTGASPDSVVYGSRLTWVQPPPGAATDGAAPTWNGGAGQNTYTAPQTGSAAASAGASGAEAAAGTGNSPAAASTPETQTAPAQSTPSTAAAPETQTAPAQSTPATAAAPDDVQGSATPAQPTPSAAPLDVHDTAVPTTPPPSPASQGSAPAPTAPAPASSSPPAAAASPAATPAPTASPATPTTVVPTPASSTGG